MVLITSCPTMPQSPQSLASPRIAPYLDSTSIPFLESAQSPPSCHLWKPLVPAENAAENFILNWEYIDPYGLSPLSPKTNPSTHLFSIGSNCPNKATNVQALPSPKQPLKGLRIVLDPGHFGGLWSELEKRRVYNGEDFVDEGDLNLGAALLTARRLKMLGALVTLTRNSSAETPFPHLPFAPEAATHTAIDAFLSAIPELAALSEFIRNPSKNSQQQITQTDLLDDIRLAQTRDEVFAAFNRADLSRRAYLSQKADIFLSLHHNIAKRTTTNRVLLFSYGNVLKDEWDLPQERHHALRQAQMINASASKTVGMALGRALGKAFNLPTIADDTENQDGKKKHVAGNKYPIDLASGLFARNLGVLKRAHGLAYLLEGPCMNNPQEHQRLRLKNTKGKTKQNLIWIKGKAYPKRITAYAKAIVMGLRNSFSQVTRPISAKTRDNSSKEN